MAAVKKGPKRQSARMPLSPQGLLGSILAAPIMRNS
jgi:hypothetical protein